MKQRRRRNRGQSNPTQPNANEFQRHAMMITTSTNSNSNEISVRNDVHPLHGTSFFMTMFFLMCACILYRRKKEGTFFVAKRHRNQTKHQLYSYKCEYRHMENENETNDKNDNSQDGSDNNHGKHKNSNDDFSHVEKDSIRSRNDNSDPKSNQNDNSSNTASFLVDLNCNPFDAPSPRIHAAMAIDSKNGNFYLLGGKGAHDDLLQDLHCYNRTTHQWTHYFNHNDNNNDDYNNDTKRNHISPAKQWISISIQNKGVSTPSPKFKFRRPSISSISLPFSPKSLSLPSSPSSSSSISLPAAATTTIPKKILFSITTYPSLSDLTARCHFQMNYIPNNLILFGGSTRRHLCTNDLCLLNPPPNTNTNDNTNAGTKQDAIWHQIQYVSSNTSLSSSFTKGEEEDILKDSSSPTNPTTSTHNQHHLPSKENSHHSNHYYDNHFPKPRYRHAMCSHSDTTLFLFGGITHHHEYLADVWILDVKVAQTMIQAATTAATNVTTTTTTTPTTLKYTTENQNSHGSHDDSPSIPPLSLWKRISCDTRKRTKEDNDDNNNNVSQYWPKPRADHGMVRIHSKIFVMGGRDEISTQVLPPGTIEIYHIHSQTWSCEVTCGPAPSSILHKGSTSSLHAIPSSHIILAFSNEDEDNYVDDGDNNNNDQASSSWRSSGIFHRIHVLNCAVQPMCWSNVNIDYNYHGDWSMVPGLRHCFSAVLDETCGCLFVFGGEKKQNTRTIKEEKSGWEQDRNEIERRNISFYNSKEERDMSTCTSLIIANFTSILQTT